MIFTDDQRLPCLEGEDWAAYALYMQCLATQLDTQLGEQYDAADASLRRPAAAWVSTTVSTGLNDGSFLAPGPRAWSQNWPTTPPSAPRLANLRGWWYVGANVNLVANGVSTADSFRRLQLVVTGTGFGTESIAEFNDMVFESNSGNGESLCTAGTVYFDGVDSDSLFVTPSLNCFVYHNNVSGLVDTTLNPPFTIWVVFLGNTPEIGVTI